MWQVAHTRPGSWFTRSAWQSRHSSRDSVATFTGGFWWHPDPVHPAWTAVVWALAGGD